MEPNIFRYIWNNTRRDQLWILFIVLLSMPPYFLFFDLPKQIVNGPIQGKGFEAEGATTRFLELSFTVPEWISDAGTVKLFSGFELDRIGLLTTLSLIFLALVCINGLFKFYINTYKGRLGERTLRRLRYELIDRVMRFPNAFVRRMKASEAATMVKDEVEPLGVFIGEAFVDPVFLSGQALVAMLFIMVQSYWLGGIALALVLFQAFLIPRLRHRLLELGKVRQLKARALAGRVGEIVEGAPEIHVNDTSNFERADISDRLSKIYFLRFEFYQRKFFIKFLNNFLSQVTPFLFYFIGGYFAITGRMDIGQLVAVIAAYKDLPNPIRDLINWDQTRLDVQIKYSQVIVQFTTDEVLDADIQALTKETVPPLKGDISAANISVFDDTGAKLVEGVSFKLPLTQASAAIGEVNSGAEAMSEVLARLLPPTRGTVAIGGHDIYEAREAVTGRRLGYVGPDTYFRQTSLRDNLLYGLQHAPLTDRVYEGEDEAARQRDIGEARRAGNPEFDVASDWIDYHAAGVSSRDELEGRMREILELVDLAEDVFNFGLRGRVDPAREPETAAQIIEARGVMRDKLTAKEYAGLVEPFDPAVYSNQATIGENILFGTAGEGALSRQSLPGNAYLLEVLKAEGLDNTLIDIGRKIAETILELFAGLAPDHPFFEQLSFMDADEMPEYEAMTQRVQGLGNGELAGGDRAMLLKLALAYIEPRHRLSQLDDKLRKQLIKARKAFRKGLPEEFKAEIAFYDPGSFNALSSLADNILFGRIAYGVADGERRINDLMQSVLAELGLRPAVFSAGLEYNVGIGGKRLSIIQRQKLSLARALIKRPDLLIINKSFAGLESQQQTRLTERVLEFARTQKDRPRIGLFWVLSDRSQAMKFDEVLVFERGGLPARGKPEELLGKNGKYANLL